MKRETYLELKKKNNLTYFSGEKDPKRLKILLKIEKIGDTLNNANTAKIEQAADRILSNKSAWWSNKNLASESLTDLANIVGLKKSIEQKPVLKPTFLNTRNMTAKDVLDSIIPLNNSAITELLAVYKQFSIKMTKNDILKINKKYSIN